MKQLPGEIHDRIMDSIVNNVLVERLFSVEKPPTKQHRNLHAIESPNLYHSTHYIGKAYFDVIRAALERWHTHVAEAEMLVPVFAPNRYEIVLKKAHKLARHISQEKSLTPVFTSAMVYGYLHEAPAGMRKLLATKPANWLEDQIMKYVDNSSVRHTVQPCADGWEWYHGPLEDEATVVGHIERPADVSDSEDNLYSESNDFISPPRRRIPDSPPPVRVSFRVYHPYCSQVQRVPSRLQRESSSDDDDVSPSPKRARLDNNSFITPPRPRRPTPDHPPPVCYCCVMSFILTGTACNSIPRREWQHRRSRTRSRACANSGFTSTTC
jgi:hypothetical protein